MTRSTWDRFLSSEQELLNPPQPFKDSTGAIHIPISQAMKLIEERGLPVRPNAPAAASAQMQAADTAKAVAGEQKHP